MEVLGIKVIVPIGILCIVLMFLLLSGCTGSMDVSNRNNAIDSWNRLAEVHKSFDSKASQSLTMFGDHLTTYNSIITQSSPNYDLLKTNYETDKNNIDNWDSYLDNLDKAITDFAKNSADLTGDKKDYADDILTNIRTYHSKMGNAQLYYKGALDDYITYIDSAKMGYPDSSMLQSANNKKDTANRELLDATAALSLASDLSKRL